jgi:cysteine synthase A
LFDLIALSTRFIDYDFMTNEICVYEFVYPYYPLQSGIGIGRITNNFRSIAAELNGAFYGTDQEAIDMAYYLLHREGIFIGPSAALNVVGAVKLARQLGPGHNVVTIACDGGDRYLSKLYNSDWLNNVKLKPAVDYTTDNVDFVK